MNPAAKDLKKKQITTAENMFFSLECQGILSKTVVESIKKANIITWSKYSDDYAGTVVQLCTNSIFATAAANCFKFGEMERNI